MSEARTSRLISIRFYNEQTATIVKFERSALTRVSDLFRNLVENLDEGDSEEIALEEEDVYEAAMLLMNIVNFYHKKDQGGETAPPVQVWNRSKAILTEKWLIQEYVEAYGALIKQHIEEVIINRPAAAAIEVAGVTKWSSCSIPSIARERVPCFTNGIYDKIDQLAEGLPIYSRRGLDINGKQWTMKYKSIGPSKKWHIVEWHIDRGYHEAEMACLRCNPPVLPHLIKEVWNVADQDAPGTRQKMIAQPAVKVSLVSTPLSSADVLLFWEMVGTIFQYVGLMRGPIHSMEDLVDVLSTRKDLRVMEEMDKVMSVNYLLLLLDQLN